MKMTRAILVKSCQRFASRQRGLRESWFGYLRSVGEDAWMMEGGHQSNDLNDAVLELTCEDNYRDNSIKLRLAIDMLLRGVWFDYLFICDDDTFVHPQRWLAHQPAGELECRLFMPTLTQERKLNHGRPWVHGGAGWWMSRRLCQLYVADVTERTSADDICVALVAAKHGIEMVDRPDLYGSDRYSGRHDRVSADNSLITCHHVQPDEMVELWEATHAHSQ